MKFIIGFIILIVILTYIYTDKKDETVEDTMITHNILKKKDTEIKISKPDEVPKKIKRILGESTLITVEGKKGLIHNNNPKKTVIDEYGISHSEYDVDEYGISHSEYDVDENLILSEINHKTKIELDNDIIQKIELEIENSFLIQ